MKKKKNLVFIIFFLLTTSCKKQPNLNLAKNYYEQSLVEVEEKNSTKAIQLIDKSIEISPSPQALALKAAIYYQNKQFSESLAIFKKIMKEKNLPITLKTDIINNIACTHLALGQVEEAKKMWIDLTNNINYLSPEVAWFNMGMLDLTEAIQKRSEIQASTKLLKNAQTYFSKAISIANEYVDAYFYLAITNFNLKDYYKTKEILVSILSIVPDHEPAKEFLNKVNKEFLNVDVNY